MPSTHDPDRMSDVQRLQDVAQLFATAILRLRARPRPDMSPSKETLESSDNPLELSAATRLSVTTG